MTVNLTREELTVLSDILRRLPTTGLFTSRPEFETALIVKGGKPYEVIDDSPRNRCPAGSPPWLPRRPRNPPGLPRFARPGRRTPGCAA